MRGAVLSVWRGWQTLEDGGDSRRFFGRSHRACILAGLFWPRGGRAPALSEPWPLEGRKGTSGRGQGSVRSALAALFGTRKNFSASGGLAFPVLAAAAARPCVGVSGKNFCGKLLARPSPNRKAARVPNAIFSGESVSIPEARLPARRSVAPEVPAGCAWEFRFWGSFAEIGAPDFAVC